MALRSMPGRFTLGLIALGLCASLDAAPCNALEPHHRSGWYFGLGFGPSRGALSAAEDTDTWLWDKGSAPQLRLGRLLGQHVALGFEWQSWFPEGGTAGDDLPLQIKLRVSGQIWALAGSWYPGSPESLLGGFFLRAGAGPAISSFALAIPDPSDPEGVVELQARIDQWGWGAMFALGYEARVSEHFAAGVQVSSNHLMIDEDIHGVWFGGPVLHLLWYF